MVRTHKVAFTPTLRVFISKVITPVVLVAGLLILILFNFRGVLKTTTANGDHFQGVVAFSQGAFSYRFSQGAGIDRPLVRYGYNNLLSYADWNSTIAIDGNVTQLWNTTHGYSVDEGAKRLFSTMSAGDWQLVEVATLVNDHTMTVTYSLVPQPHTSPWPKTYRIDIAHVNTNSWFNYQTSGDTFSGLVTDGEPKAGLSQSYIGALTLKVQGEAAKKTQISLPNPKGTGGITSDQGSQTRVNTFVTTYIVEDPTPQRMITLGTETVTFQPGVTNVGTPLGGTMPLPAQPTSSSTP